MNLSAASQSVNKNPDEKFALRTLHPFFMLSWTRKCREPSLLDLSPLFISFSEIVFLICFTWHYSLVLCVWLFCRSIKLVPNCFRHVVYNPFSPDFHCLAAAPVILFGPLKNHQRQNNKVHQSVCIPKASSSSLDGDRTWLKPQLSCTLTQLQHGISKILNEGSSPVLASNYGSCYEEQLPSSKSVKKVHVCPVIRLGEVWQLRAWL